MPARKSFTMLCAPNPIATPAMPAPAISGPGLMPNCPSAMRPATREEREPHEVGEHFGHRVGALIGAGVALRSGERRCAERTTRLRARAASRPHTMARTRSSRTRSGRTSRNSPVDAWKSDSPALRSSS